MGSLIEINDTLKISRDRGFPNNLRLRDHIENPQNSSSLVGQEFRFWNEGERIYHRSPVRVFLVEEMPDGRWLYWGNAIVLEQTIKNGRTEGRYKITKIYNPDFQKQITIEDSPSGKGFFHL